MKILIAHPYHQHEYRLAEALKKAGHEVDLATTVYTKPGSLTSRILKLLPHEFGERALVHRCDCIDDEHIYQFCEAGGLIRLFLRNIKWLSGLHKSFFYRLADCFSKKAAEHVIRHHYDAVVTYDNLSPVLFDTLMRKAPEIKRIMDVSSANIIYMRKIYEKDMTLAPMFARRLKTERAICWDEAILMRVSEEISVAQKFLIPSRFVARSLMQCGIKEDQLLLCPYGVDVSEFAPQSSEGRTSALPVRFVYVGGVKEFKGVAYLFDAFMDIPQEKATLTVVGTYYANDEDVKPYLSRIKFTGNIMHSKIPQELHKADVFILASLGEGLSLSTLEAAACGMPLIVTENSGVNDGMTENAQGFVIPIQSKEAIREKVLWFVDNRDKIRTMGEAARQFAMNYSWENYNKRVAELFWSMDK